MSADNYFYIRKHEGRYAVTQEWMSDSGPSPVGSLAKFYSSIGEAYFWANQEEAEYGVRWSEELGKELDGIRWGTSPMLMFAMIRKYGKEQPGGAYSLEIYPEELRGMRPNATIETTKLPGGAIRLSAVPAMEAVS